MDHTKKSKHISFRVTEEQAIEIEMAALDAGIKAREWCRNVVLEKLGSDAALTPNERLLFHTLIRVQYLVTQGFQLLADQNLTSDGWKKLRANAKYRVSELVTSVLETYTEKRRDRTSGIGVQSKGIGRAKEQLLKTLIGERRTGRGPSTACLVAWCRSHNRRI